MSEPVEVYIIEGYEHPQVVMQLLDCNILFLETTREALLLVEYQALIDNDKETESAYRDVRRMVEREIYRRKSGTSTHHDS